MNRKLLIALFLVFVVIACNKEKSEIVPANSISSQNGLKYQSGSAFQGREFKSNFVSPTPGDERSRHIIGSQFIPADSANEMINSYIYSIEHSATHESDIHSFSIDADSLRKYLMHTELKHVKLIFAHTMDYIHSGYRGVYAGMQSGAVTIIIAGYDNAGNYVYHNGGNVLDHCIPCPTSCPSGNAGDDLLR